MEVGDLRMIKPAIRTQKKQNQSCDFSNHKYQSLKLCVRNTHFFILLNLILSSHPSRMARKNLSLSCPTPSPAHFPEFNFLGCPEIVQDHQFWLSHGQRWHSQRPQLQWTLGDQRFASCTLSLGHGNLCWGCEVTQSSEMISPLQGAATVGDGGFPLLARSGDHLPIPSPWKSLPPLSLRQKLSLLSPCLPSMTTKKLSAVISSLGENKSLEQKSHGQGAGCVSRRRVWRPFLLWASVLGKDAKKNLRSCPLQESLLTIREERTGCKELITTEQLNTHKERTERTR